MDDGFIRITSISWHYYGLPVSPKHLFFKDEPLKEKPKEIALKENEHTKGFKCRSCELFVILPPEDA